LVRIGTPYPVNYKDEVQAILRKRVHCTKEYCYIISNVKLVEVYKFILITFQYGEWLTKHKETIPDSMLCVYDITEFYLQ
jgi:hypothetical protein